LAPKWQACKQQAACWHWYASVIQLCACCVVCVYVCADYKTFQHLAKAYSLLHPTMGKNPMFENGETLLRGLVAPPTMPQALRGYAHAM